MKRFIRGMEGRKTGRMLTEQGDFRERLLLRRASRVK